MLCFRKRLGMEDFFGRLMVWTRVPLSSGLGVEVAYVSGKVAG
jgi:hypothetical protein